MNSKLKTVQYLNIKNINLLIIIMLFFSFKGNSQNTKNIMQTIITAGNDATGSSGSVAYSIGQVIYTYIGESVYTVAQGIQQQVKNANLEIPEIPVEAKAEIFVYPNPTTDYVNIKLKDIESTNEKRSYQLYDIQGKLIKQNSITDTETQLSLSGLGTSIYILRVNVNNKVSKSFKILKK